MSSILLKPVLASRTDLSASMDASRETAHQTGLDGRVERVFGANRHTPSDHSSDRRRKDVRDPRYPERQERVSREHRLDKSPPREARSRTPPRARDSKDTSRFKHDDRHYYEDRRSPDAVKVRESTSSIFDGYHRSHKTSSSERHRGERRSYGRSADERDRTPPRSRDRALAERNPRQGREQARPVAGPATSRAGQQPFVDFKQFDYIKTKAQAEDAVNRVIHGHEDLSTQLATLTCLITKLPEKDPESKAVCHVIGEFVLQHKEKLNDILPRNLAQLIHRCGKLEYHNPALFRVFSEAILRRDDLSSFNPQNIANILWAFAKADIRSDVFEIFSEEIRRRDLSSFNPQNIANILWAFATLGIQDREVLGRFAEEILRRGLRMFNAQEIANMLWAFATLGIRDREVLRMFSEEIRRRDLNSFDPQTIANILWAFATLDIQDREVFGRFAEEIRRRDLSTFSPQNIANILWAFATLGIQDREVFRMFSEEIRRRDLSTFSPQNIANILWAFATLDIQDREVFRMFSEEIRRRDLSLFDPQDIANILWAFAMIDVKDSTEPSLPLILQPFIDRCSLEEGSLSKKHFSAFIQVKLVYDLDVSPEELARFKAIIQSTNHPSLSEGYVSDVLEHLYSGQFQRNHQLDITGHIPDFYDPTHQIAIEFDGPCHYLTTLDGTKALNGASFLRNWFITQKERVRLITIPYFEWSGLDQDGRAAYLRRALV